MWRFPLDHEVVIAKQFYSCKSTLSEADALRAEKFIRTLSDGPSESDLGLEPLGDSAVSGFWAARLGKNTQLLLHRDNSRVTVLYAGTFDEVNTWATSRRISRHPVTGARQLVVEPSVLGDKPDPAPAITVAPLDFSQYHRDYLLSLGVPEEWISKVQSVQDKAQFWQVHSAMPEEAAENLYTLALGELPQPIKLPTDPRVMSLDEKRRFFLVQDLAELQRMLCLPFREWMLYLHPSQRNIVDGDFNGPVKITGMAGTGKTVVAIHRARVLAQRKRRVLLTSYTNRLCSDIDQRLTSLCTADEASLITVRTVDSTALTLLRTIEPRAAWIPDDEAVKLFDELRPKGTRRKALEFLLQEWTLVIGAQGLMTWEDYRDALRTGRCIPLTVEQRSEIWKWVDPVLKKLTKQGRLPWGMICRKVRDLLESGKLQSPYDAVVVDEVQDLNSQEIAFLAALAADRRDLMLIGDAGQRIYPGGFSLRSLGIEVRGRSRRLTVNYRTTAEIERYADQIRGRTVDDLDDGSEDSHESHCLLRGPEPILYGAESFEEENKYVVQTICDLVNRGIAPEEIGVLARTTRHYYYFLRDLTEKGIPAFEANKVANAHPGVHCSTMHGAKGLEFRYVFIVGCREDVVPAKFELKEYDDPTELEAALQRERNLLYVSITRARDQVYITWTGKPSRFLSAP